MIESKKTVIILSGITLLLLLAYMLLSLLPARVYDPSEDEISIFSYKTDEISRVVLRKDGKTLEILRDDDNWTSGGTPLDHERADLIVTLLAYLYSDNYVGRVGNLAEYGLESPSASAEFGAGGEEHTIQFGVASADGKSVYMLVDGGAEVYSMPVEAYDILFSMI